MRFSRTIRNGALAVLVILAAAAGPYLFRRPLQAQPITAAPNQAGGFDGGSGGEPSQEIPQVYVQGPVTAEAAATWLKLQKRIDMPFANETPLEDVLKYIQTATAEQPPKDAGGAVKDPAHRPLQVYVDPIALQEAEKTMASPVTLQLEGIPASTGLQLVLKQLDLTYFVQKDGILVIEYKLSGSSHDLADPTLVILNTLNQLRNEVAQLKAELAVARGRHNPAPTAPPPAPRGVQ
jgi:hypothetical protein